MRGLLRRFGRRAVTDRRAEWRAFAAQADGHFEEGKRASKDRITFRHGPWLLTLERYTRNTGHSQVPYTRVRAYFRGHRGFRLAVRRKTLVDRLGARLGVGSGLPVRRELADHFVVRGSPPSKVPSLLASPGVLQAARAAESFHLHVRRPGWWNRRRLGEGVGVVVCQARGVVRDPLRLGGLIRLVREVLDGLLRVGAANGEEVPTL